MTTKAKLDEWFTLNDPTIDVAYKSMMYGQLWWYWTTGYKIVEASHHVR